MTPPVARPGKGRSETGDSLACKPGGCLRPVAAAASFAAAMADAAAAALDCWAARTSGGIWVAAGAVLTAVCMLSELSLAPLRPPPPLPPLPPLPALEPPLLLLLSLLLFPLLLLLFPPLLSRWGVAVTSRAAAARRMATKVLVEKCIFCRRDTCGWLNRY